MIFEMVVRSYLYQQEELNSAVSFRRLLLPMSWASGLDFYVLDDLLLTRWRGCFCFFEADSAV